MRPPRGLVTGLTLLAVLGLSALAAPGDKDDGPDRLDPDAIVVRLTLGIGDDRPRDWSGKVQVDQGEVLDVEGWRFREGDLRTGPSEWRARSRLIRKVAAKKKAAPAGKQTSTPTTGPEVTPNGVLVTLKAPADATLSVETAQGRFDVKLADLADGSARRYRDGEVEARLVPPSAALVEGPDEDDFPAAASDGRGGAWVVYVAHEHRGPDALEAYTERPRSFKDLVPTGGGDRIRLLHFADGRGGQPIDVTEAGRDVWRPAVALAGDGGVVVAWSENTDGNWDLFARTYDPEKSSWSDPKRLTTDPGPDAHVALATDPDGRVWMAWQASRNGQADILLAPVEEAARAVNISNTPANEWTPALAIDKSGTVHVAYDSYRNGNYDVFLYSGPKGQDRGRTVAVTGSSLFEARPSLAVDGRGRAWVAYEEQPANWGKDAENLVEGKGATLYRSAAVRVRCVDGGRLLEAPDPVARASSEAERKYNNVPRLSCDAAGRVWLLYRHRMEAVWGNNAVMVVGGVWVEYATSLAGAAWDVPRLLTRSDNLMDNRPAVVPLQGGPVLAVYSTDGRLRREVETSPDLQRRFYTHSGTPPGVVDNDLQVAALTPAAGNGSVEPALGPVRAEFDPLAPPVHPNEAADIARLRDYRIQAGGKTYRPVRGDFHRHTELSQDGGNDGTLEDMWRYALDAANFDWMGNNDHDNGGSKEYTWWLVQKTTDLYHQPGRFAGMFTYERSVVYPGGHRNVMFPRRGVRTLPRLINDRGVQFDVNGRDLDAEMLYDYLKELGGICASHTTGTGMGTDWRANDPKVEPFVEIFQGHRNSYEHLGAPRVARRPGEAIGGWRPLGMVWNALALQYRLGFQASSDHISTHISYAIALAEEPTREGIFAAFQARHCYGATDNILLDVRSGEHLMGDEFTADGPVTLRVLAHGTGPIRRVDVIKDFAYVFSTEPKAQRVAFEWTDDERRPPGLSWYYVRVLQEDGQLAWGSPMWVHSRGSGQGE